MSTPNTIQGDTRVYGNLSSTSMTIPAGTVRDVDVNAAADIAATKLEHQYVVNYGQANAAAADEVRVVHVVKGQTATIIAALAGSIAKAVGDATCTVDFLKNGTTILSAVITLDNGNANYTPEDGTISVTSAVHDDVITIAIDGTIGTGTLPTGVYGMIVIREDAA